MTFDLAVIDFAQEVFGWKIPVKKDTLLPNSSLKGIKSLDGQLQVNHNTFSACIRIACSMCRRSNMSS